MMTPPRGPLFKCSLVSSASTVDSAVGFTSPVSVGANYYSDYSGAPLSTNPAYDLVGLAIRIRLRFRKGFHCLQVLFLALDLCLIEYLRAALPLLNSSAYLPEAFYPAYLPYTAYSLSSTFGLRSFFPLAEDLETIPFLSAPTAATRLLNDYSN
ncbi:hypothetical protein B296_00000009 [Ensete ventricosum]|uniref:Uncharacterized protein n=1 Tax=Ensete ventricosum TaxID=4639 RepID=A0A427ASK9_ENSVE|nr:hypothetical protein B296_00000009 [Ensete ventricosum]